MSAKHLAFSFGNSGALDRDGALYLWGCNEENTNWATTAGLTARVPTRFTFEGFPREHSVRDVGCAHWYTVVCLQEVPQLQSKVDSQGNEEQQEAPAGLVLVADPPKQKKSKKKGRHH